MRQLFTFFGLFFLLQVSAQNGYDWGDDKSTANKKWFHVTQYSKGGDYENCVSQVHWLLNNAPNLHVDLYIEAAKVYKHLAQTVKDPARAKAVQDSLLWIYDERIKRFGDEANVLNRKGLVAYTYLSKRPEASGDLFNLYSKIFELNKQRTYGSNMIYWMATASPALKKSIITENQFLQVYFTFSDFVDAELEKAGDDEAKQARFNKMQGQAEAILETTVTLDCEKIKAIFGDQFTANTDDLDMAKKVYRLMRKSECYGDELLYSAIHTINEKQPSANGYRTEAEIYKRKKEYNTALGYFQKAEEIASNSSLKAELHLDMAKLYSSMGQKSNARAAAYKSIEAGGKASDAYNLIGNLYLYSFENCKSDDVLKTRSIYIAAYEMYKKAGNTKMMAEAQSNFPSAEDIFNVDKAVGDPINTGCWINEDVTLQKR